MATGPQHYREAERLASMAHRFTYGDGADPTVGAALAAEAQAHATLALAAATALSTPDRSSPPRISRYAWEEWQQAAGVQPPEGDDL
ncbi:hypothetical protein AB0907_24150 [Streptomyces sp. NPDC006975]|uniref:hypothetical protein n=1 Tax=Streptomyces sp. NPDC006975 TaxID=3154310 RepID=UPI003451F751